MYRLVAIWAWLLGVFAVTMQFIIQLSSGAMVDGLIFSFHLNGFNAGLIAGAYYPVYCLLQVPAGILVGKIGSQKALMFGLLAAGWATMCFAFASSFYVALLGRFFSGIALSVCFVSLVDIIHNYFEQRSFGLMIGLAEALIVLAVIVMELVLPTKVAIHGWQIISEVLALILILLSVMVTFFTPKSGQYQSVVQKKSLLQALQSLRLYIKNKGLWGHSLYGGSMFAILTVFEGLWAQPFFTHAWGFSIEQASHCNAFILFGVICGAPLAGLSLNYKHCNFFLGGLSLCTILILYFIINYGNLVNITVLFISLFLLGLSSSSYVVSNSYSSNIADKSDKTTLVGWNNMVVVIISPLIQPLIGWWIDHGSNIMRDKYIYALNNFVILLLVSFIISIALIVRQDKLNHSI